MSQNNRSFKRRASHTALMIICVTLAVVLVLLVAGTVIVTRYLGLINKPGNENTLNSSQIAEVTATETVDPEFTGATMNGNEVTWNTDFTNIEFDEEHYVNILLAGLDRREGEDVSRSDAMVLVTFNKLNNTITMSSFMRDMYVPIPGYFDSKLNDSYFLGGPDLLQETITHNFGVPIDGVVAIDFYKFADIVELVGGVDIDLTEEEAEFLNETGTYGVGSIYQYDWTLVPGVNRLTGEQALAYARIRALGGRGDFDRTGRQRTVLEALMRELKNTSFLNALGMLDDVLPMVTTNMSDSDIIKHIGNLLPMLANAKVEQNRIPEWGHYESVRINGRDVLLPDLKVIREYLKDKLLYETEGQS